MRKEQIYNYLNNVFFWCGIHVFNYKRKKLGGFNHFIARWLFARKLAYLTIEIVKTPKLCWIHQDDGYYYDGYHNKIHVGFLIIYYGT